MSDDTYQPPFPTGPDTTQYRNIGTQGVSVVSLGEHTFLRVEPQALVTLAKEALREASFFLRPAHQQQVAAVLSDPQATPNDRFVARTLLQNSVVASEGVLPVCQDTGTAIVMGKKGQFVLTTGDDAAALSRGIYQAYQDNNLRYSQMAPITTYQEQNTGNNLPAQIDLYATQGMEYRFTFVAKGGGSANKMYFFQETPALLRPDVLEPWLIEKMHLLGTSACPPYHLVFVIGGTSIERTTKVLKMASVGDLDDLPTRGNAAGQSFRDVELEQRLMVATRELGIGAQFGGVAFAHDVRVIRMSRHGASLPIAMGVSCSADRNIRAKITQEGLLLEQLEHNPGRWLTGESEPQQPVPIDLDRPMPEVLAELSKHPVKTRLSLSGTLIVARDLAHARLKVLLDQGEPLPDYIKNHPIYYAGPAKKPEGMPSGSFGPTTASRMDSYIEPFQAGGAALITLAKGNRSRVVTESCQKHGGFYLGSIGGPAAILAKDSIQHVEVVDFPELGMEAVWKIRVSNFPAFILIDDKGNDFFDQEA